VTAAVARLDPADRAALKLAALHSLSDHDLGAQLGLAQGRAKALRERALSRLAVELDAPTAEAWDALTALSEADWLAAARGGAIANAPPVDQAGIPEAGPPARGASGRRPGRAGTPEARPPTRGGPLRRPVLGVLATAAVAAVIAVLVIGGDRDDDRPGDERDRAVAPAGPSGTVRVVGSGPRARLRLTVRGLRRAVDHRVWLFNAILDARPLGSIRSPGALTVALPARFRRYRYIDVSRQPPGAGDRHSGTSLLRAATTALRGGAVVPLAPPAVP